MFIKQTETENFNFAVFGRVTNFMFRHLFIQIVSDIVDAF
jgi:hypothetical protein